MSGSEWWLGLTLCCAANVLSPIGYILQKRSAAQSPSSDGSADEQAEAAPRCSSQWLCGCALVLLSILLSFVSSAFTAQSILAPLSSLSLIVNMVASRALLGEKVSRLNALSAVLIVAGSVLSVVFGDHDDTVFTNDSLLSNFHAVEAILYGSLSSAFSLVVYLVLRLHSQAFSAATAESAECCGLAIKLRSSKRSRVLRSLMYCVLAGLAGAQSDLFGKMVVELVRTSAQGDQQLLSPYPYLYMSAMLAFAALQIHFLSHGLVLSDALYCLPLYECVAILTSTVGATLLFGELDDSTTKQLLAFAVGVASLLAGVAVMTLRDSHVQTVDADGVVVSARHNNRQSILTTATMLAQMNVRRWKVTRVMEDEDEGEADEVRARKLRSKSQSHHDPSQSPNRVERERRMVSMIAAQAVALQSKGEMRLPAEVELSVVRLSRAKQPSAAHHADSPVVEPRQISFSRSNSLPTFLATALPADAHSLPIPYPSAPPLAVAIGGTPPSHSHTLDRWAHAPSPSSGVDLPTPSSHSRRVAVSREDAQPALLDALAEEPLGEDNKGDASGTVSSSAPPPPPPPPRASSAVSSPTQPLLRIIRVQRVAPSPTGRSTISRGHAVTSPSSKVHGTHTGHA